MTKKTRAILLRVLAVLILVAGSVLMVTTRFGVLGIAVATPIAVLLIILPNRCHHCGKYVELMIDKYCRHCGGKLRD